MSCTSCGNSSLAGRVDNPGICWTEFNKMKTPLEQCRELFSRSYALSWWLGIAFAVGVLCAAVFAERWSVWLSWLALTGGVALLVQYVRLCTLAFDLWEHHLRMREDKNYHARFVVEMNSELTQRAMKYHSPLTSEDLVDAFAKAPAHAGAGYAYYQAPDQQNRTPVR
jgi:hypothetical protein